MSQQTTPRPTLPCINYDFIALQQKINICFNGIGQWAHPEPDKRRQVKEEPTALKHSFLKVAARFNIMFGCNCQTQTIKAGGNRWESMK